MLELTASIVGLTWNVKFYFWGLPVRNSSLGVICQKTIGGSKDTHPWTASGYANGWPRGGNWSSGIGIILCLLSAIAM
jgi:hypothetical protein